MANISLPRTSGFLSPEVRIHAQHCATLSPITSMRINYKQLWSCEEASYFFRVYLQPKQRKQSFHSLSCILADLMWDATAFFVTLLCLRRLHFTGEQRCAGASASWLSCGFFRRLVKCHKFVKCLISAQTSDEKYSPMFIPSNMCQKVSQSAVSKLSHDPHDTQTDAQAAPILRFQMCSGFSPWWNPSPSEGSSSSGLLISGLFIPLNFSMAEYDITLTCCFWHTSVWACVPQGRGCRKSLVPWRQ